MASGGDFDVQSAHGQVDGLLVTEAHSLREILRPAEILDSLRVFERGDRILFQSEETLPRGAPIVLEELVQTDDRPSYTIARAARDETPRSAQLDYIDIERDYEVGSVRASLLDNPGSAEFHSRFAVASSIDRMNSNVETVLFRAAQSSEEMDFALPADHPIAPGEVFDFPGPQGQTKAYRVDEVTCGSAFRVRATSITEREPAEVRPGRRTQPRRQLPSRRVSAVFLDLPLLPLSDAADTDGSLPSMRPPGLVG